MFVSLLYMIERERDEQNEMERFNEREGRSEITEVAGSDPTSMIKML